MAKKLETQFLKLSMENNVAVVAQDMVKVTYGPQAMTVTG